MNIANSDARFGLLIAMGMILIGSVKNFSKFFLMLFYVQEVVLILLEVEVMTVEGEIEGAFVLSINRTRIPFQNGTAQAHLPIAHK